MKRCAMILFCLGLSLLLCGAAEAKSWKRSRCCYQYGCLDTSPVFCLQFPLFDDCQNTLQPQCFYAYDTYDRDPCNLLTSDYGWDDCDLASPQSCWFDDCRPDQPYNCQRTCAGTFVLATVVKAPHQLQNKIHKNVGHRDVMPANATFSYRDPQTSVTTTWTWHPHQGLTENMADHINYKVPTTSIPTGVPVRVLRSSVNIMTAASHAAPIGGRQMSEYVQRKFTDRNGVSHVPPPRAIAFGVELKVHQTEANALRPSEITGLGEATLVRGDPKFPLSNNSAYIRIAGDPNHPVRIATNTNLD